MLTQKKALYVLREAKQYENRIDNNCITTQTN